MTLEEWEEIQVGMLAYWPNRSVSAESFRLWFADLEEFPAEQVGAAIRALGRDGREWIPTGGQIREKVLELREPAMDHSEAYELAMRAAGEGGGFHRGLEWLEERSPLAAAAVRQFGWRDWCFQQLEPGTRRAQFREVFRSVAERQAARERYRGLEAAGLPGLTRSSETGFLSFKAALPAPADQSAQD